MKEICKEYKNNIKDLLNNKVYMFFIILVAVLSYGFAITNFSVGIDDLCFDRYVTGSYILSAGRWGTTALYAIAQIFKFTPFWLEMVVTLITVGMGIVFAAFLKKECSNRLKNIHYIIATSILISYPILHQSFIYQSTNLSVIISNLVLMITPIIIYESFSKNKNLKLYFLIAIILPFFISMYESCCQTYICMMFIIAFIRIFNNKKDKNDDTKFVIKYILLSIIILTGALIINSGICYIIKNILNNKGLLEIDYSSKGIPWLNFKNNNVLEMLKNNVGVKIAEDFRNLSYIRNFIILALICLLFTIIEAVKKKKFILIPLMICVILSNFIINILQVRILYRIDTSWSIAIAFFAVFILININEKTINNIMSALFCIIILFQTKQMNQAFYNDYVRYKKEANYAYSLANGIIAKCEDTNKPLVYLYKKHDGTHQNQINADNGWSLINWSSWAFGEPGSEMTKFINSLGYNFNIATNEQRGKVINDLNNSSLKLRNDENIYETDKYIVIVMDINI